MLKKKIVITGVGVISSNGIGKDRFQDAVFKGVSGVKPISLFDTSEFKVKSAGEISDFEPAELLGSKGLRTLDRSTKLINCASKLALDDAKLDLLNANTADVGVAIGATLGSIRSIREFHQEAVKEGPRYVNPAFFPNTVISSPASQVSIRFNIKGFNITLSTGFSAGLDAVDYAVDFIESGRARIVLAGGVEEMCVETFVGFYRTALLAGLKGEGPELSCPFDKRHNGFISGEAAAILILEDLESAISRKARIYAEISGTGRGYDISRPGECDVRGEGIRRAMRAALEESNVSPADIDYVCAAANSAENVDIIESQAIKDVFGPDSEKARVSSIKSMTGECFSASGTLQAAAAVGAIERQAVPPTINFEQRDPRCGLNYVFNEAENCKVGRVLINAFGPGNSSAALVISNFNG